LKPLRSSVPDPLDPNVLGLPDPDYKSDVWIRIRIRFRILLSSSKNSKKNLDSYCFVTSFGLFILENDVHVNVWYLQKVIGRKIGKNLFFVGLLKVNDENRGSGSTSGFGSICQRLVSPDPDPHQNVMDQEHCSGVMYSTVHLMIQQHQKLILNN
jgi:hypothetical protein